MGTAVKKFIFVNQSVSGEIEASLAALGYIVIRLPSFRRLGRYVCCHPDSIMFPLPDGRLLVHAEYFRENQKLFLSTGLEFALTDEPVGQNYPQDVLFNALAIGGTLFGRLDAVSKVIKAAYTEHVGVKQGYARCSVLALGERAAATADPGMARALSEKGISVLLLPPDGIILRAYGTEGEKIKPPCGELRYDGFIGGCGVMLDGDSATGPKICGVFGEITAYKHFLLLSEFAGAHGIKLVSLCRSPLEDLGGAVIAFA